MARTEGQWKKKGSAITTSEALPVIVNDYLNFGGFIGGDIGYGIRSNGGVIEIKNAGGDWLPVGEAEIASTFETISKNLSASDATLAYTGDNLTSVTYSNGVVKTLNYTGDNLTSVVLSGTLPSGINLTKTLSYSGDNLTGITYS